MNRVDRQLRNELRTVQARLAALEAAVGARPARRKRIAAPRPDDDVVAGREKLWAKYIELEMRFGHGRVKLTKLSFAVVHRLNPDEFCRWFSSTDRRGIPAGSGPDLRFRQALTDAISELEARSKNNAGITSIISHGKMLPSQDSGARLH